MPKGKNMNQFAKTAVLIISGAVAGAGVAAHWCYKNQAMLALLYNLYRER